MKKIISALIGLIIYANLSAQDRFIDDRDGNIYRTISVEGTIWMIENLKFKANGGAFYFNNDSNNIPGYGILYDWKTAQNSCPEGWYLPSGSDYRALTNYFQNKETWRNVASEPSSFGIQLGGMQNYEGTFTEMDESGYYWTSTEYDENNAEYFSYLLIDEKPIIDISREQDVEYIHGTEKSNKYSVRCIKK